MQSPLLFIVALLLFANLLSLAFLLFGVGAPALFRVGIGGIIALVKLFPSST